jgi:hypothetical protein
MDDAPEPAKPRGTRPFEAMVPCKPWTSQFLALDEVTAIQSRRGPGPQRFRDGTFRPDRPLPPGRVRGQPEPKLTLSPRAIQRPDPTWFWEGVGGVPKHGGGSTSRSAYAPPMFNSDSPRPLPPKRNELSTKYRASCIGDIVFSDDDPALRQPKVPTSENPLLFGEGAPAPAPPSSGAELLQQLTEEQRLKHIHVAIRHEKRKTEQARANLMTNLRNGIIVDPMHHEPMGMVNRGGR